MKIKMEFKVQNKIQIAKLKLKNNNIFVFQNMDEFNKCTNENGIEGTK